MTAESGIPDNQRIELLTNAHDDAVQKSDDSLLPIIKETEHVDEALQCRICLEGASSENLTASPCLCSGTMGHLHSSCLEEWLTIRDHHICEICLYPLRSPRPSIRQCSQPQALSQPQQLLPPLVGGGVQPLDPIGMTLDIVAMLVMALGFMYVGYALMQQNPNLPTSKHSSTRYVDARPKGTPGPEPGKVSSQQMQVKSQHRQDSSSSSGMEVTIFCAAALFLILLSTCGNVAIQLLRVPTRRNGNAVPNQPGFAPSAECGEIV